LTADFDRMTARRRFAGLECPKQSVLNFGRMTCIGKVFDGKVALPEGVVLPDGTEVEVHIDEGTAGTASFADRFKDFIGMARDLPPDLAENLDHYLHDLHKK
jgi:hypothetical protein